MSYDCSVMVKKVALDNGRFAVVVRAEVVKDGKKFWAAENSYWDLPADGPALISSLLGRVAKALKKKKTDVTLTDDSVSLAQVDRGTMLQFQRALVRASDKLVDFGEEVAKSKKEKVKSRVEDI